MQISKILTTISILVITWAPTHYTIDEMQAKAYDTEKGYPVGRLGAMIPPKNQWERTTVCSVIPKM